MEYAGYGQLAAAGWNTVAKKILTQYDTFTKKDKDGKPVLNGDRHGWAKDSANSLVTGMLTFGKDMLPKYVSLGLKPTRS